MDHCVKSQQELFWSLLNCRFLFGLFDVREDNPNKTNMAAREASQVLTRHQMSTKINASPLINSKENANKRKDRKDVFLSTVTKSSDTAKTMAENQTRAEEESIIYGARYEDARREYIQSTESQLPAPEIDAFLQIYRDNQCDPNRGRSNVNANVLTAGFIAASSESDCLPTLAAGLIRPLTQEQQQIIIAQHRYEHGYPDLEGHMIEEFLVEFENMALSAIGMLRARAGQYRCLRTANLYKEKYDYAKALKNAAPDPMAPIKGVNQTLMSACSPQSANRTALPRNEYVYAEEPVIEELSDEEIDADIVV